MNHTVKIQGRTAQDDGLEVDLPGIGWEYAQEGTCPDCGGQWVWFEAGFVPGTRKCLDCDSFFSVQGDANRWYLRRERFYR